MKQIRPESVVLSADELAAPKVGLESEKYERIYTFEEAVEFARHRRKESKKLNR